MRDKSERQCVNGADLMIRAGVALVVLSVPTSAVAQTAPPSDDATAAREEARESCIGPGEYAVPIQLGTGHRIKRDTRLILNVQPVMPFSISDDRNLIARVILPYISQPSLGGDTTAASGVGDVLASLFLSPRKSEKVAWRFGPVIRLRSTTQPTLG
jgi:hypothetical protein